VRKVIAVGTVLVVAGTGVGVAYQVAARQRDYRAGMMRGDSALRDDQTFAAIEAYSGAIALRQDSMLAYLRRGETYRKRADRGDLEAAARDFRQASRLDPSATRPLEELADVRYQLQQYDRAIDAYEQVVKLDDRAPRVNYKLALARYRSANVDGALAALEQTIRLDDRMADAFYLRGICLRAKNKIPEALKAFEKAVALSPALIPAREELADLYGQLERRPDQLDQLQLLAGLDRVTWSVRLPSACPCAGAALGCRGTDAEQRAGAGAGRAGVVSGDRRSMAGKRPGARRARGHQQSPRGPGAHRFPHLGEQRRTAAVRAGR
jgi:tetratricopeptide (TPR) repeat protein